MTYSSTLGGIVDTWSSVRRQRSEVPMDSSSSDDLLSNTTHPDRDFIIELLHELRSPLTVVGGRVSQLQNQLRQGDPDPAQLQARLNEISIATRRMTSVLETFSIRTAPARLTTAKGT